jgi:hypothetical protein
MTDTERGKVGNDRSRLNKGKIAIELQAIRRTRDGRALLHLKNHTTHKGGSMPCASASVLSSSLA